MSASKLADGAVSRGKLASGISQCPSGTVKVLTDLCADNSDRSIHAAWSGAMDGCQAAGFRLPDGSDALAMLPILQQVGSETYWTQDVSSSTDAVDLFPLGQALNLNPRTTPMSYRCVATPTAP